MGKANSHHRPLVGGIAVAGARQNSDTRFGPGTLTCLATRNNAAKTPVLVTNLHVVVSKDRAHNPDGNEKMFQHEFLAPGSFTGGRPTVDLDMEVGQMVDKTTLLRGPNNVNTADVAICELTNGISVGAGARYALHDHPIHDYRPIYPGVVDPKVSMELVMVGAYGG